MKSLPVLDARCVIFQCKATPEFYKPCNCLFVCHSHIIFLKSASRISTLYGTKCYVSQYKSIVRMLPFAQIGIAMLPVYFVTQESLLDFYKFRKTRRDCSCSSLLKVLKETSARLRGCGKGVSASKPIWMRKQKGNALWKNKKGHKRCTRDHVPIPTEGRESTDLTSLILLPKIPFRNWRI